MNLEQAIHERWAASPGLCALLPAERFTTGMAHATRVPFATLTRKPGQTLCRTNAGDALDAIPLQIHVWHDEFDAGQAISREVKKAFDRASFAPSDTGRILHMRRRGESVVEHADGVWQWTIGFMAYVYLALGY